MPALFSRARVAGFIAVCALAGLVTTAIVTVVGTVFTPRATLPSYFSKSSCVSARRGAMWMQLRTIARGGMGTAPDPRDAHRHWSAARSVTLEPGSDTTRSDPLPFIHIWVFIEAGWPCTSTWGWRAYKNFSSQTSGGLHKIPRMQRAGGGSDIDLPVIPHAPGLAANTAIYGATWALLIVGAVRTRRAFRGARGRCRACNYDLRGLTTDLPCPECGRLFRPT